MSARKYSSAGTASPRTNGDDLKRAVNWILNDDIFVPVKLHGNISWAPAALVRLAVFWVWSAESSLVAAAEEALGRVVAIFGSAAVRSYQALTGALKTYTRQLLPLLWRRLHFHDGRGEVFLLTNVLSEKELTDRQAGDIYRRRWGVEVQFRWLKQTFGRSKLRSRTPDCAEVELHWSLVGLWMIQLLALKEQTTAGEPPDRTSIAAVLRIIRSMMYKESQIPPRKESLHKQLEAALTDAYDRHGKKKSRHYPRRKEEPSAGKPQIRAASENHKEKLRQLETLTHAA